LDHKGDTDVMCGLIQPIFRLGKSHIWPSGLDAIQCE